METDDALLNPDGGPMFRCATCGEALTPSDLLNLKLRLPEPGESYEEYAEAELIDKMEHLACAESHTRGSSR
jgi:hypothetical protein